jgi:hypothetical protein
VFEERDALALVAEYVALGVGEVDEAAVLALLLRGRVLVSWKSYVVPLKVNPSVRTTWPGLKVPMFTPNGDAHLRGWRQTCGISGPQSRGWRQTCGMGWTGGGVP